MRSGKIKAQHSHKYSVSIISFGKRKMQEQRIHNIRSIIIKLIDDESKEAARSIFANNKKTHQSPGDE